MAERSLRLAPEPGRAGAGLIGPGDPLPFERVNTGAGGRILLVCDHASRAVPAALDGLGLDAAELERHIGWDIGAADVTRLLAGMLGAPAVLSGYSRLVIDCNRALDHPGLILAESDGTPVPGNRDLDAAAREARIAAISRPYHTAIDEEIARLRALGEADTAPAVISIHSFTPVMDGIVRPWQIGILWNRDGRIAEPLIDRLRAEPDLTVGDNEPYSAREGYGDTIELHAERTGLAHALVEVRQDLIDTRHGAEEWAGRIAAALRDVLVRDDIYRPMAPHAEGGR